MLWKNCKYMIYYSLISMLYNNTKLNFVISEHCYCYTGSGVTESFFFGGEVPKRWPNLRLRGGERTASQ